MCVLPGNAFCKNTDGPPRFVINGSINIQASKLFTSTPVGIFIYFLGA